MKSLWKDYCENNLKRCLFEAKEIEKHLVILLDHPSRLLTLDFMCFDESESNVKSLANYLSKEFDITVDQGDNGEYWRAIGRQSPLSIKQTIECYSVEWVRTMCDFAASCGCTFSSWRFTDQDTLEWWGNSGRGGRTQ